MSCKFCNKKTNEEEVQCASCEGFCHPSCLVLPDHIVPIVKTYDWQCNDCKYCYGCHDIANEGKILFCDRCDRGYHTYCVKPKLKRKPKGDWFCPFCMIDKVKEAQSFKANNAMTETTKDDAPSEKRTKHEHSTEVEDREPQTSLTGVVSQTDISLYETAKKKTEDLLALEHHMGPANDGLKTIQFGDVEIDVWYKSQYPLEYSKSPKIYVCEFCLDYSKSETIFKRHMAKCEMRYPPGEEIYRKENLSVFEVDGMTATKYCQNLCLLAKLFLDHKTLYMNVSPFLFYVMTQADVKGCHMLGYFSKEKKSFMNYNLSCILVMPHHMRNGYGKMLIDFSYLLSQKEGKAGTPERPLSDLGLVTYRRFWEEKLLRYLLEYSEDLISVKAISEKMSIDSKDIISTMQFLGMIKYWKGKHMVLLRKEHFEEYSSKFYKKTDSNREIDPTCLTWEPMVSK